MSWTWLDEREILGTLLNSGFVECRHLFAPNTRIVPPPPNAAGVGDPSSWAAWSLTDYQKPTLTDYAMGRQVFGRLSVGLYQQEHTGEAIIRGYAGALDLFAQAVQNRMPAEKEGFEFLEYGIHGYPLEPDLEADGRNWYGIEWTVWFTRFTDIGPSEVATLAGLGLSSQGQNTQENIPQPGHGLTVGQWVRLDPLAVAFVPALADEAIEEPYVAGIVSRVEDADHFSLTFQGCLLLPSHGFPPGTLYLSQDTPGAATATPPASGVSQIVATSWDADHLILFQRPGVVLIP